VVVNILAILLPGEPARSAQSEQEAGETSPSPSNKKTQRRKDAEISRNIRAYAFCVSIQGCTIFCINIFREHICFLNYRLYGVKYESCSRFDTLSNFILLCVFLFEGPGLVGTFAMHYFRKKTIFAEPKSNIEDFDTDY